MTRTSAADYTREDFDQCLDPEDEFPGWVKLIIWIVLGVVSWAVLVAPVYLIYLAW